MIKLYDILKAEKTGFSDSLFTAMLAKKLSKPAETVKELESTPPLSFTAKGEPLIDWSIGGASGGVGDKTSNLLDTSGGINTIYVTPTAERYGYEVALPAGTYTVYSGLSSIYAKTKIDTTYGQGYTTDNEVSLTLSANGYILIYSPSIDTISNPNTKIMLNEGSTAVAFEPYGYKISVTCGGETKTIYLDAPLGASDSISMTDTGISISTVDGSNTLSVGTTVQPSSVYIKYKG